MSRELAEKFLDGDDTVARKIPLKDFMWAVRQNPKRCAPEYCRRGKAGKLGKWGKRRAVKKKKKK